MTKTETKSLQSNSLNPWLLLVFTQTPATAHRSQRTAVTYSQHRDRRDST